MGVRAKHYSTDLDASAPGYQTDGIDLAGLSGVRVTVKAKSTDTITSGKLKAYFWDPNVGAATPCPELDLTPTATKASTTFKEIPVQVKDGSLFWAGSSLVVSGSTTAVDVTISGWGDLI